MCHKIATLHLAPLPLATLPLAMLRIKQAKLFAYQQPFKAMMQFKASTLNCREGLILQLINTEGESYYTEIAPLPGFSRETLSDVKVGMMKLLADNQLSNHQSTYHSVQFALDSLFSPSLQVIKTPINIDNVPLLQGDKNLISQQYNLLNQPNLIKLKVARGSIEEDILNFHTLCQLNSMLQIRCDANQAWNTQQAAQFFNRIDVKRLDYIEEPTNCHQSNLQLAQRYQLQLGLDETLQQSDFIYQHHHSIKALIIKPSLIGSKERIDRLISVAEKNSLQVSFSSSFESVLGLQQIKNLALHYQSQVSISLGIDTLKYFQGPLLMNIEKLQQDCLQLECLCNVNY